MGSTHDQLFQSVRPLTSGLTTQAVVREATRDQLDVKITLRSDTADKLGKDPSIKAMIYCASDPITPFSKAEISFPYQIEIKVNQDEVKANLRGLKNKPGSTRPADITNLLRKRAGYENSLTVIYALTAKASNPYISSTISSKMYSCFFYEDVRLICFTADYY